ncbi:hypothetical protein [Serratia sp. (in: enterobacteria)]|uniref:hypothetical protein n=1 Tax=Serratia sp. (in: enterobacteria) TaxID=616 RepID=UPI003989EC96
MAVGFTTFVNASTHATANTEQTFIELDPAAGKRVAVYRFKAFRGNGTQTTTSNRLWKIRAVLLSAAGAGGVSGTVVKKDPTGPNTVVTATIKTGSTNFSVGTIDKAVDQIIADASVITEWFAIDQDDMIVIPDGRILGILVSDPSTTQSMTLNIDWIEW